MKRIATLLAVLVTAACLTAPATLAVAPDGAPTEDALRIEQVQAKAPALQLWFASEQGLPTAEDLQVTLDGVPLLISDVRPVAAQDPAQLFFLVDCSTSTTAAQLQAVKQALRDCADNLGAGERVTLISFGVEISVLAQDTQDPAVLRAAADALQANQGGTRFFDALAKAAQLADSEETALWRKTIYVFSDSVDYHLGGYTQAEVEALLAQAGAPLYALGFDTGTKQGLDALGAVARTSGGEISVVNPSTLPDALQAFRTAASECFTAALTAPDNRASNAARSLTLTQGGHSAQREVWVRHSTPDTQPPRVVSAAQQGEDSLLLTFSEAVMGAQLAESYTVQMEGGSLLGVAAVSYNAQEYTALLTLAAPPQRAVLQIACPGVTDASAQQNPLPLQETAQLEFTGPPASAAARGEEGAGPAAWALLTLLGVVILLVVAFAVIRRRGGLVVHKEKLHFGEAAVVEQPVYAAQADQVHVVQTPQSVLQLDVVSAGGAARRLTLPMQGALFVGRSDVCDVIFDDAAMSRQHFVIEEANGQYTLTNLSEQGQTRLNGVPVQHPRPLQPGDVIEAGQTRLLFAAAQKGGAP